MNADGTIDVILERPDSYVSWGFRLTGGSGASQPLNVQLVYDDTIADEVGLEIGDRILKIGGEDATILSNFDAKRLVSQQGDRLCLQIRKRRGNAPFPMGNIKKAPETASVICTAQPARAEDEKETVPPPTPPSPATAASGASWSNRPQRANVPNYQRNITGPNFKPEPWYPPAEPIRSEAPKQREFKFQVPALKPQVVPVAQVVTATAVPSAEAHVSEETITLNLPQSGKNTGNYQPYESNRHMEETPDDTETRVKLPSYQRDLLLRPGVSPPMKRREGSTPPTVLHAPKVNTGENETNISYFGYQMLPTQESSTQDESESNPADQRAGSTHRGTHVVTLAQPRLSSQEVSPIVQRHSVSGDIDGRVPFTSDTEKFHSLKNNFPDSSKSDVISTQNNEEASVPVWTPPPMQPQQTFNIDYSKMASFPAYAKGTDISTTDNSKRPPEQSNTQSNRSPNSQSPQVPGRTQGDEMNRSSPVTKRDSPIAAVQGWNSPRQSRNYDNDDDADMASLPAYQRDLINRVSPGSSLTRRADQSGNMSPRWNSPGQPRKTFNPEDISRARDQINRTAQSGTLTRQMNVQDWDSPVEPRYYETEEEAQLASLPAYQRDLLNRGSPASTLTRQRLSSGSPNSSSLQLQANVDNSSTSTLPAYQRDLMNKLAATSVEPRGYVRPVEPVESEWYESDRRFSVPAYQRDLLAMGSHFDKSASLGRRRGSSTDVPPNENNDPPQRPMLARTYTPSEAIDCDICGKAVIGPFVRILSKYRLHPECVRCNVCGLCLRDTTRVMMEDKLFCEPHALEFAKPPGEDMVPVIVYPNAK